MGENAPRGLSRRSFLRVSLAAGAGVALYKLGDGVSLSPPPHERTFELFGGPYLSPDTSEPLHAINVAALISSKNESRRENYEVLSVAKRALNSFDGIKKGFNMNVDLLDGDLSIINGIPYLEHGLSEMKKGPFRFNLPFVFDLHEKELKLGRPHLTLEEGLLQTAARNRLLPDEEKRGVLLEFKRGRYSRKVLENIFSLVNKYDVKAYFFDDQIQKGGPY